MKKHGLKLIVTFETTDAAICMEKRCREENAEGRLIPLPREISAGCGLSWCTDPKNRESIIKFIKRRGIEAGRIYEIEL